MSNKKKKEQQQTVKNDDLMEILKSNFNLDGIKFTTSSKTGATKLEKKNSTTTLNMKNNPIESENIFRHLNFVVGTEKKRKVIKTNLEKGVSQNNFKLKNGELLYDDDDTIQRKVPITDEQIDEILEDEYDQSEAGKGKTLCFPSLFHLFAFGIKRNLSTPDDGSESRQWYRHQRFHARTRYLRRVLLLRRLPRSAPRGRF